MWLEVCKYVLFKWWRHSVSTHDNCSIGWDNQFSQRQITEKWSQIHRKFSENRPLGPPLDSFGATLEPLGKHLGHMYPKDCIFEGFWDRPGSPRRLIWLQLGGLKPSKIDARARKSRCQKITCFRHRSFRCLGFILNGFLNDFLKENTRQL